MRLAEIVVYPLKGARGIQLEQSTVLEAGLAHDRRFMLVAEDGAFITQRSHPKLACVETELRARTLVITAPGVGTVEVPLASAEHEGDRRHVRVWDDAVEAVVARGEGSDLLSRYLGRTCSLLFMPEDSVRAVEAPFGRAGDRVGFADAYPVLIATRASLADLNARLASPVPMNRFRPNLVVEGGEAFEEERYGRARIGAMTFRMPKRCARCTVITVDQAVGVPSKEPLKTLASYRTEANKVHFALNAIPDAIGAVAIGDAVTYLDPL